MELSVGPAQKRPMAVPTSVSAAPSASTRLGRRAVAEMLEGHPHVAGFHPGEPREGGGGVTVVELKE